MSTHLHQPVDSPLTGALTLLVSGALIWSCKMTATCAFITMLTQKEECGAHTPKDHGELGLTPRLRTIACSASTSKKVPSWWGPLKMEPMVWFQWTLFLTTVSLKTGDLYLKGNILSPRMEPTSWYSNLTLISACTQPTARKSPLEIWVLVSSKAQDTLERGASTLRALISTTPFIKLCRLSCNQMEISAFTVPVIAHILKDHGDQELICRFWTTVLLLSTLVVETSLREATPLDSKVSYLSTNWMD